MEGIRFNSRGDGDVVQQFVVSFFGFGGRDVADEFEQSAVVEPVNPFQCRKLDGFKGSPWSTPVDHFCFVEAVDCLGQGIFIAVTNAADGWLDASFRQSFGVFDREILATAITMVDQPATVNLSAIMQSLLQSIQHKAGIGCPAEPALTVAPDLAALLHAYDMSKGQSAKPCRSARPHENCGSHR